MVLEIHPVSINDASTLLDITFDGYGEDPIIECIFGKMPLSDSMKHFQVNGMKSQWGTNPFEYRKCVRDSETGEIASAIAYNYEPVQEGEEWKKVPQLPAHPDMDGALWSQYQALYWDLRLRHMGSQPFMYMASLATLQRYQGRGAASMLVEHSTKQADELNLPMFLQASGAGRKLYLRHGFVDLEQISLDVSKVLPDNPKRSSWAMFRPRRNPSQPTQVPAPLPTLGIKVSRINETLPDFINAQKVNDRAFGPNALISTIFGGCKSDTPEMRAAKDLEKAQVPDSDYWFFKATDPAADPEGNNILGCAKWFIARDPHLDHRPFGPEWPEGCNVAAADAIFKKIRLHREDYYRSRNQGYAYMMVLVVAPEAQRRGVGSALLRASLAEVDRLGYDSWIEASPEGLELYRKFGWEDLTTYSLDLKQYGGPDIEERAVVLIRKSGAAEKKEEKKSGAPGGEGTVKEVVEGKEEEAKAATALT